MSNAPGPRAHEDYGWWHIWDNPSLSVYEKSVAQAIYRKMFRGNCVALKRKVICELASISRSQLIRCESSLIAFGVLQMAPTKDGNVFLYRIRVGQMDFFNRRTHLAAGTERSTEGLNPSAVENAVDNNEITARPAGAGTETSPTRGARPPDLTYQEHIETQNLTNSNSTPGAEVRADSPNLWETQNEKRQRVVWERIHRHWENTKSEEDNRNIEARDARAGSTRPLTREEYEERRRLLQEQANRLIKAVR